MSIYLHREGGNAHDYDFCVVRRRGGNICDDNCCGSDKGGKLEEGVGHVYER